MMRKVEDLEVELTRMSYYESKKTDFEDEDEEEEESSMMVDSVATEEEAMALALDKDDVEESEEFDFTAWSSLSTLKFFYRSAIDPRELKAIIQGATELKDLHLACVHDDHSDLPRAVALDLVQLKEHRKLRRIVLNYHHLSRESMRRRHAEPLAACMNLFDWNAWSPHLEEIVVTFVGLRGVQTDAIIVSRNAAGKMQVQIDDCF